jgi:hypothetical protein
MVATALLVGFGNIAQRRGFILNLMFRWEKICDLLIGPYELQPLFSGASYLHSLTEELSQLLEDAPLASMWLIHDRVLAHFIRDLKQSRLLLPR